MGKRERTGILFLWLLCMLPALFLGYGSDPDAWLVAHAAYALGKKSPTQRPRWEAMERSMHAEKERLKKEGKLVFVARSVEKVTTAGTSK